MESSYWKIDAFRAADASDFPEASEMPELPRDDGEPPRQVAPIENELVLDILRRLIIEDLRRQLSAP